VVAAAATTRDRCRVLSSLCEASADATGGHGTASGRGLLVQVHRAWRMPGAELPAACRLPLHPVALANAICAVESALSTGKCPVLSGNGGGGSVPSTSARRFLLYHSAALVLYFCAIGVSSRTPCNLKKAFNRALPPSSMSRS